MSRMLTYSNKGKTNSDILVSSTCKPHFYNVTRKNKRTGSQDLVARIFKVNGEWFLWYERASYKIKVSSFGECLKKIEREF